MIIVLWLVTIVVAGPMFYLLLDDYKDAAKTNGILHCQLDEAKIRYNREITDRTHRLTLTRIQLAVASNALSNIANQNAGQATFEIWAKKIASDALLRLESKGEGLNPKGPTYL